MGNCLGACVVCLTKVDDRYAAWKWRDEEFSDVELSRIPAPPARDLHSAVIDKSTDAAKTFCKNHPERINDINSAGETGLHLACKLGYLDIVNILLEKGCDPNIVTELGTPLHCTVLAVKGKYMTSDDAALLIKHLVVNGCSVNAKTMKGDKTALFSAAEIGDEKLIKTLLSEGCSVNCTESNGFTPFYMSCLRGDLDCVTAFIERCSDLNINQKDTHGRSALMSALICISTQLQEENLNNWDRVLRNRYIRLGVIEALLYAGADPNGMDCRIRSPLIIAFSLIEQETIQKIMMLHIGMHSAVVPNQGLIAADSSLSSKKQVLPFLKLAKDSDVEESMFTPVIRLLLMHGARCPEHWNTELLTFYDESPKWLKDLYEEALHMQDRICTERPYSLLHLARITVRQWLSKLHRLHLIKTLPLPPKMISFLQFHPLK